VLGENAGYQEDTRDTFPGGNAMPFLNDARLSQLLRRETEYLELKEQGVAWWMDAYHEEQVENARLTKRIAELERVVDAIRHPSLGHNDACDSYAGKECTCGWSTVEDLLAALEGREM